MNAMAGGWRGEVDGLILDGSQSLLVRSPLLGDTQVPFGYLNSIEVTARFVGFLYLKKFPVASQKSQ